MTDGRGVVYLVGAGPGDPRLLTLRALELLRSAEVVVYDRLVHPGVLAEAPDSAELIFAGKEGGVASPSQEWIHRLLIDRAEAGYRVVRLKGGDPLVFGRGGEEALALAVRGIRFEWVPGISSALAVPAYAGVPATHRGLSQRLTVVSGHDLTRRLIYDVADMGTLVILMGSRDLSGLTDRLLHLGLAPETPAAIVKWGTWGVQRSLRAPLGSLAEAAAKNPLGSPAAVVVGEAAGIDPRLNWWETLPLSGCKICVVATGERSTTEFAALRAEGAEVIIVRLGAWRVEGADEPGPDVFQFGTCLVFGRAGAEALGGRLRRQRVDLRRVQSRLVAMDDEAWAGLTDCGFWDAERLVTGSFPDWQGPCYAIGATPEQIAGLPRQSGPVKVLGGLRMVSRPLDAVSRHWLFAEESHYAVFTSPTAVHRLRSEHGSEPWELFGAVRCFGADGETARALRDEGLLTAEAPWERLPALIRQHWLASRPRVPNRQMGGI
ncbi:MAG: uroporphyrinogen-III C-methyltransferase [Thermaerobacter sp.]|nr:uroporphyrinogen-III C-methyltransferase [Thermaerobacter sp.]